MRLGLFLVADGCGGMAHGEKISQLIVDSFQRLWEGELAALVSKSQKPETQLSTSVCKWLDQINLAAYNFGRQVGARVGSTLALLLTLNRDYYIFSVGDSRVYLKRKGQVHQLSEDQSRVADMLRNGEISPEDAINYPKRNVLTMCVGGFEQIRVFQKSGRLRKDDIFLLCSDGLYEGLGKSLEDFFPDSVDSESARRLRCRIAPGKAADNISAILIQILPRQVRSNDT